ncbi:MAG: FKBP-type peptidyl-prolyl cis-trans isomerase [Deltaproteobacteria bacterium]|nr:FKBP-type peptidyl-prolyl cis-trans isomerase [Deltaproteobacteria bacterium]
MKTWRWVAAVALVLWAGLACAAAAPVLKDQKAKRSYAIGMDIGNSLKRQSVEVDPDLIAKGVRDVVSGGKTLLTDQEARDTLMALQKDLMAKAEERMKALAEKNKKDGEVFLAENKKKEGVVTLPSGLQYKVVKEGAGPVPTDNDVVETNYRGTLIDGTEFDSSYKRGQTATFPVKGVIPGWTAALKRMKVGSKWQLFIPPGLAYGARGAGRDIGPNATLIFDVELLGIKK